MHRKPIGCVPVIVCCLVLAVSCHSRDSLSSRLKSPTSSTPTTPSPAPTLPVTARAIRISGNLTLTSIGQTTQLTVTATYPDESTKDVTPQVAWSLLRPIGSISNEGFLTVSAYGRGSVLARFEGRTTSAVVTATPAGTVVIDGRVREPGAGGIPKVTITEMSSGRSAISDDDGYAAFAEIRPGAPTKVLAKLDGYEPGEGTIGETLTFDVPLQRIIRVVMGETVKPPQMAPHDLEYTIAGRRCFPCRMVRMDVPEAGTVEVRVTSSIRLSLVTNEGVYTSETSPLVAEVPIARAGEAIVYIGVVDSGVNQGYVPFTITATRK